MPASMRARNGIRRKGLAVIEYPAGRALNRLCCACGPSFHPAPTLCEWASPLPTRRFCFQRRRWNTNHRTLRTLSHWLCSAVGIPRTRLALAIALPLARIVSHESRSMMHKLACLSCVIVMPLALAGCLMPPKPASVAGECKIFDDPGFVVRGERPQDRRWISKTTNAGVTSCGWPRPKADP